VTVTQVEVIFWIFAVVAIVSASLCITRRSPVASALWLVVTMFALAAIFVLLDAQFIAAIQVLVYAGAIMVLFLFVIMLLNLGRDRASDMLGMVGRLVMLAVAGLLAVELWVVGRIAPPEGVVRSGESVARLVEEQGVVGMISEPLYRSYLVPFEVTGMLLLTAIVGAVVLAKRRV
jgi:NADH-quinone oxidoreductase subunit J